MNIRTSPAWSDIHFKNPGKIPRGEKRQGPVRPLNSAASIVASPLHGDLLVSADLTSDRTLSATSKVATLHRSDCSLSVDLSTNEISATGGHRRFVLRQGPSSTIRHCRAGAGASAGACALCLIGPSPACIRHRRRRDTAPWTHFGDVWGKDEQTNCAWNLKHAGRVSGQKKARKPAGK